MAKYKTLTTTEESKTYLLNTINKWTKWNTHHRLLRIAILNILLELERKELKEQEALK